MLDRFCKWHLETRKTLVIATYITGILLITFIVLAFYKQIWTLALNEIGDSLAGMIGSLGFIWLVITVLTQNRELMNQVQELRESKDALKAQSQSLESAEIFTALEYADKKLPEFDARLQEIKKLINDELQNFLLSYISDRPQHINFKPELDICEVWGYFIREDRLEGVNLIYSENDTKENFDYEAYLKLETINRNMGYVISFLDNISVNARDKVKSIISQRVKGYEVSRDIAWYRKWHEILTGIEKPIKIKIYQNNLAPSEVANLVIKLSLERGLDE